MGGLRVLIAIDNLTVRAGGQLYVRDLATALLARGHTPVVYSTTLGEVADELRGRTIPVVDSLDRIGSPPDIVHGHNHLETMTALLHFPGVAGLYTCHSWLFPLDAPPRFPRIRRYVAVDHTCRDRLVCEHGVPPERVSVVLNFVDLARFAPRAPLPERPRRALVFGNYTGAENLRAVREACARAGLSLDVVGIESGNVTARPEELLGRYEIVFAKGRAAIEALAVGAAVILCGMHHTGPMVTSDNLEELRPLNFGIRALREPPAADSVGREIARYDPADAAAVSRRVRATAGRDEAVDELVGLYEQAVSEQAAEGVDAAEEGRAAAAYLRTLAAQLKGERAAVLNSATLRLRERVLGVPVLGPAARRLARLARGNS